ATALERPPGSGGAAPSACAAPRTANPAITAHRAMSGASPGFKHHTPAHHGQCRLDTPDPGRRHRHVVAIEHDQIRLLADFERAEVLLLEEQIGVGAGMRDEGLLTGQSLVEHFVAPTSRPLTTQPSVTNGL